MIFHFLFSITECIHTQGSNVFAHEISEYGSSLATFLEYQFLGDSEASFVSICGNALNAVHKSTGMQVFQDQHDASSRANFCSDISCFKNSALCLKTEWKATELLLVDARDSLVSKFHKKAIMVFPRRDRCIVGLVGCPSRIEMYIITYDTTTKKFDHGNPVSTYLMSLVPHRIRFVVDLFKVCRWIASIEGPVGHFHLVPERRKLTRNKHHITWVRDGLLKEFNNAVSEESLNRMDVVIRKCLPHVEWGYRVDASSIFITSVGFMAKKVLSNIQDGADRKAMRDKMIQEVKDGLDSLHFLKLAHCDLCLDNVFYEESSQSCPSGRFFLEDLEYLTPFDGAIPNKNLRLPQGCVRPSSVKDLDHLNYGAFVAEAHQH